MKTLLLITLLSTFVFAGDHEDVCEKLYAKAVLFADQAWASNIGSESNMLIRRSDNCLMRYKIVCKNNWQIPLAVERSNNG